MPQLRGSRTLQHTVERVFNLAINLEQYPDILPYVKGVSIIEGKKDSIAADLNLGLSMISFTYRCHITFLKNEKIIVTSESRLFKNFQSECKFTDVDDQSTKIFYTLDATFKNPILELAAKVALPIQTQFTIDAFENHLDASC